MRGDWVKKQLHCGSRVTYNWGKAFCRRAGVFTVFAGLLLLCGCQRNVNKPSRIDDFDYTSVVNNHLTLMDLAYHFKDAGLNVVQIQPVRADVLRATAAAAIMIDKDEIGVYYFNTDVEQQRKIIAQYHEDGFAYILAFRFPVFMAGSFVVTGAEKHPKKKEIVAALRSFK